MACEGSSEISCNGRKRNPPRRGQIKARIIGSLVKSVLTMASRRSGRAAAAEAGGDESASTMSPSSGYSSEAPAAAAAAAAGNFGSGPKQRAPAPTFFLSSTRSLDGFVVEVPQQVRGRYSALEPACRGRD